MTKGRERPLDSARNSKANMAKIKSKKPPNGPLEKPPAHIVNRAKVQARKQYLFVPEPKVPVGLPDPPPPVSEQSPNEQPCREPKPLPKAEKLFKNHLYNQSSMSGW